MTADSREGNAMSKGTDAAGAGGRTASQAGRGGSPVRRVAFWTLLFVVCYALTLSIFSDSLFLLAVPGIIGLVTVGSIAMGAVVQRPVRSEAIPYATDGTDYRGPVQYHRSVLLKRVALIVAVVAVLVCLALFTQADLLFPLLPLSVVSFVIGSHFWIEQLRWIGQCSRVLNVYGFETRAPVETVDQRSGGKRTLRLGAGAERSPKMFARQPMGQSVWPKRVADSVWFAGDDVFGGVVLVPGTGEILCVQPLDWQAAQGKRDAAGGDRREKAKQAGLDRQLR